MYKFNFDETRKLITVVATDSVDMASSLESLRALRLDPRYRSDYRILCNFLDTRYVPNSAEGFALASVVSSFFRGQKIALVVRYPELESLRELIATISSGNLDINVFDEMKAAERYVLRTDRPSAPEQAEKR